MPAGGENASRPRREADIDDLVAHRVDVAAEIGEMAEKPVARDLEPAALIGVEQRGARLVGHGEAGDHVPGAPVRQIEMQPDEAAGGRVRDRAGGQSRRPARRVEAIGEDDFRLRPVVDVPARRHMPVPLARVSSRVDVTVRRQRGPTPRDRAHRAEAGRLISTCPAEAGRLRDENQMALIASIAGADFDSTLELPTSGDPRHNATLTLTVRYRLVFADSKNRAGIVVTVEGTPRARDGTGFRHYILDWDGPTRLKFTKALWRAERIWSFKFLLAPPIQCARIASSSSATMLVILIIGFTAGPAVSL
jgi:hypothetical protein